jgi:hypothetical protein
VSNYNAQYFDLLTRIFAKGFVQTVARSSPAICQLAMEYDWTLVIASKELKSARSTILS